MNDNKLTIFDFDRIEEDGEIVLVLKGKHINHNAVDSAISTLGISKIRFKNVVFNEFLDFKFKNINVDFFDCTFYSSFAFSGDNNTISLWSKGHLKYINEPNSTVSIFNNKVEDIRFNDQFNIKSLVIGGEGFSGSLTFDGCNINTITIHSIRLKGVVSFENINFKTLVIRDSIFDSLSISGKKLENIYLNNIDCKKHIYLFLKEIVEVNISGSNSDKFNFILDQQDILINEFIATNNNFKYFHFQHLIPSDDKQLTRFKKVEITQSCKINFPPLFIEEFTLKGHFSHSSNFEYFQIESLKFQNFTASEKIYFNSCYIDSDKENVLNISNSILENVVINPSFIHEFDIIKYSKSNCTGLLVNSFEEVDCDNILSNNGNGFNYDREGFIRYLKNLCEEDKNLPLYQKYKAIEYEEIRKDKDLKCREKFVLWFNRITNNHTTDWWIAGRAILIMIAFYIALTTTFLYFSGTVSNYWDSMFILPYSISPVSFLGTIKGYSFHPVIYIIDFIYKIFYGLLLYQMIAAFRKFNK